MTTPLRLLRVTIIALIGCITALGIFGVSLWMTERPRSLASSLPLETTIMYLRTHDRSTLERWMAELPSLPKPLPILSQGTRYEFALVQTETSPAWILSIYKGKIDGEEIQSSVDRSALLLNPSNKSRGPLSQSSLFRRIVIADTSTVAWIDMDRVPTAESPGLSLLRTFSFGAPRILMSDDRAGNGSIVLESIRVPRGITRGAGETVKINDGLSFSVQNLSTLTSFWLQSIEKRDPTLAEGMHGILKGLRETWGLDESMEPVIERIASMPLSFQLEQGQGKEWHMVMNSAVSSSSDRTALLTALQARGDRGTTRKTTFDTVVVNDVIDEAIPAPQKENVWSTMKLAGSPTLWIALRGTSFVLSTDERALPSSETPTRSPNQTSAFLSAIIHPHAFARIVTTLLPFLSAEISALQNSGILPDQPIALTVESANDATIVRWRIDPPESSLATQKKEEMKKS